MSSIEFFHGRFRGSIVPFSAGRPRAIVETPPPGSHDTPVLSCASNGHDTERPSDSSRIVYLVLLIAIMQARHGTGSEVLSPNSIVNG